MRYGSVKKSEEELKSKIELGLEDIKLNAEIYANYDPTKDDDDDDKGYASKSWDENLYDVAKSRDGTDVQCKFFFQIPT